MCSDAQGKKEKQGTKKVPETSNRTHRGRFNVSLRNSPDLCKLPEVLVIYVVLTAFHWHQADRSQLQMMNEVSLKTQNCLEWKMQLLVVLH